MTCGPLEGLLVVVVLLLALGPVVLPRITRTVGKYAGSFRQGLRDADARKEIEGELVRDDDETPREAGKGGPPAPPALPG